VQVPSTLRALADFQAFEDLALHGGPSPLILFSRPSRGGFQRGQVGDVELLMENIDFLRFETGDRKHIEDTLGDILAQLSSNGCVPVQCNFMTISAIVSPIPGTARRRFSAMTRSSGSTSAESPSGAL
jgi:hypothetical protein